MAGGVLAGNSAPRPMSRQIQVVLRTQESGSQAASGEKFACGEAFGAESGFGEMVKELDRMVGLEHVKRLVYEIYALLKIDEYRRRAGLTAGQQVYHMVFKGNPGTGKTTVARIFAKMFKEMGVLKKGHLIEVERADLVGEYIGHTAIKTRELIKKALGGVLFIDEAYSLARGGEKDFGKESIDCLVKAMEDHKDEFVLILAGYTEEMEQFLGTNPGLPSRFPIQVEFADYSIEQLIQIVELMAEAREYVLMPHTVIKLKRHLAEEKAAMWQVFSNARYVRNALEKAIRHQAVRLLNQHPAVPSRQELMSLRPEDLKFDR